MRIILASDPEGGAIPVTTAKRSAVLSAVALSLCGYMFYFGDSSCCYPTSVEFSLMLLFLAGAFGVAGAFGSWRALLLATPRRLHVSANAVSVVGMAMGITAALFALPLLYVAMVATLVGGGR
jgi:hypothetical protein